VSHLDQVGRGRRRRIAGGSSAGACHVVRRPRARAGASTGRCASCYPVRRAPEARRAGGVRRRSRATRRRRRRSAAPARHPAARGVEADSADAKHTAEPGDRVLCLLRLDQTQLAQLRHPLAREPLALAIVDLCLLDPLAERRADPFVAAPRLNSWILLPLLVAEASSVERIVLAR